MNKDLVTSLLNSSPYRGPFTATTSVVTPQMAKVFLAFQAPQRKLDDRRVRVYEGLLRTNRWAITNQGLGFDLTGRLIDGQHRLHAVVKADTAAPFLCCFMDQETMNVIDSGRKRTTADLLTISYPGIKFAVLLAAVANIHLKIRTAMARKIQIGSWHPQPFEQLAEYAGHEALFTEMMEYHTPIRFAPLLAASASAMPVNRAKVKEFLDAVKTGVGLTKDSAALAARNYVMGQRWSQKEQDHEIRMWLNLIDHHLHGKSVKKLNGASDHGLRSIGDTRQAMKLDEDVRTLFEAPADEETAS